MAGRPTTKAASPQRLPPSELSWELIPSRQDGRQEQYMSYSLNLKKGLFRGFKREYYRDYSGGYQEFRL